METVGSGRVPQSWCSGFQSLQWRWGGGRKKRKWISVHCCFTSEFIGLCPKFSNNTCKDRPTKPVVTVGTALEILTLMMAVYKVIPYASLSLIARETILSPFYPEEKQSQACSDLSKINRAVVGPRQSQIVYCKPQTLSTLPFPLASH